MIRNKSAPELWWTLLKTPRLTFWWDSRNCIDKPSRRILTILEASSKRKYMSLKTGKLMYRLVAVVVLRDSTSSSKWCHAQNVLRSLTIYLKRSKDKAHKSMKMKEIEPEPEKEVGYGQKSGSSRVKVKVKVKVRVSQVSWNPYLFLASRFRLSNRSQNLLWLIT